MTLTSSSAWFPSRSALPVQFPMPGVDLLPLEAYSFSQIIQKLGNNQILFRKDINVKTFLFLAGLNLTIDSTDDGVVMISCPGTISLSVLYHLYHYTII